MPEAPRAAQPLSVRGSGAAPVSAAAAATLPAAAAAKRPTMPARYLAGLYELAPLGLSLRKQAAQVGMESAQQWILLSDAGSGLEDFLRDNFNRPDVVVILDFYHPAGYLERRAQALDPNAEERRTAQAEAWCHTMKHQGGPAILQELQGLTPPRGVSAREAYTSAAPYISNNIHSGTYLSYHPRTCP